jgi:hypothetical protein
MKHLFAILIASVLALSAHAQRAGFYPTSLNGGTNNVAAAATNTYTIVQTVSEYDNVGFQVSFKSVGTNLSTITFGVSKSADSGTTFESTPSLYLSVAANGTNTVTAFAPFSVVGVSHVKLGPVGNPNGGSALTNVVASFRLNAPKRLTAPGTQ